MCYPEGGVVAKLPICRSSDQTFMRKVPSSRVVFICFICFISFKLSTTSYCFICNNVNKYISVQFNYNVLVL